MEQLPVASGPLPASQAENRGANPEQANRRANLVLPAKSPALAKIRLERGTRRRPATK